MGQNSGTTEGDWKGEHWSLIGPSWNGFEQIRHLCIFGASYCQTTYHPIQPEPTDEEPLGVKFPGFVYTEGPNWVGHLVQSSKAPKLLVYNYAKGGHNVKGIETQVMIGFFQSSRPEAKWAKTDTLFVSWVGINDMAVVLYENRTRENRIAAIKARLEFLFSLQDKLYAAGARNFLFIDLPPMEYSPAYDSEGKNVAGGAGNFFREWNRALEQFMRDFAADPKKKDDPVSVIYFSSHKVFSAIFEQPAQYGFPPQDVSKEDASIWTDHLHPTSAVHLVLANELVDALAKAGLEVPPPSLGNSAE